MTTSTRKPRITFPENPFDGQQVTEVVDESTCVIWTYRSADNSWVYKIYGMPPNVVYTKDVLTTPSEKRGGSIIKTQEQVNELIANTAESAVKATNRTTDQVDFLQNSIGKGTWTHAFANVGRPQTGEFWTADNVTEFSAVTKIFVNEKGIASQQGHDPGTLADTRIGDYLVIQERGSNDFGMYVVESAAVEVDGDQTIREFGLRVYENRAKGGSIVNASRCQITTSRPIYVVVQDDEPKVSTRGVLWYREADDVLSISNYATGQVGVNGPQWTAINGGGGPGANPDDYLKLTGGTMKGSIAMSERQIRDLGDPISDTDAVNKRWLKGWTNQELGDYLPLAGGQMKGELAMGGHKISGIGDPTADAQAANKQYVDTRLKRIGGTEQKMEGILYLGGHKIAGVGDPELSTDAANRQYVDNQIAATPKGGSFTNEYDGNRFVRTGNMSTDLSSGEVLFMTADYKQTENPDEIAYISLPKDEFDWNAFTNSGNIKVKAGSSTAGYYYAYAFMHQASAQVLVSVSPLKTYNDKKLEADSGAPCYFHGLFFK